jgi:hypothetical protein
LVTSFRRLVRKHRFAAAWLVLAALLMKVLVPTGFMPVVTGRLITIQFCSGFGPEKTMVAMPAMGDHKGSTDHSGKGDMPCGFGGHAPSAFSTVDPVLLLLAIAFVMTLGFLVVQVRALKRTVRLRPPPIGPPLTV